MKKIILILGFVLSVFISNAQIKTYTIKATDSLTTEGTFTIDSDIFKSTTQVTVTDTTLATKVYVDALAQEFDSIGNINTSTGKVPYYLNGVVVDSFELDGRFLLLSDTSDFVQYDDSTIVFVTPTQLSDSINASQPFDSTLFSTDIADLAWKEGMFYFDSIKQTFVGYIDEADVTFEFMYENWIRVYNNSGEDILNGEVAYLSGVYADANNTITARKAQADSASTCISVLGIATHDIENGSYGILTKSGTVRNTNTSACSISGEALYLSATVAGGKTNVEPSSPDYSVKIGNCGKIHATTGTVEVGIDIGDNKRDIVKFFNGSVLENSTVDVTSNGTTITATVEKTGGGDLSLFFNGEFSVFDCTPAASVNLVAGTDTTPVQNWVYIPLSTSTLTANQTGFPTNEQYIPIGDFLCPSAATAQSNGMYKAHVWTDHLRNSVEQGHLSDVNFWIRKQHATYLSGVALTTDPLIDVAADSIEVSLSSGSILQLHPHTYAALSTNTGDSIKVINDPLFANRPIPDLRSSLLNLDSEGASLANKYYSVVLWGVVSEDAEDCQIFITLPSGSYTNSSNGIDDALGYTNKTIPSEYIGVGFLIDRITIQNSGASIKIIDIENLRRVIPGVSGAGGAGGGGAINYDELADTPPSKLTFSNNFVRVNAGETAHEYVAGSAILLTDFDDTSFPYIKADGTNPLTANWDAGAFEIRAETFESDVVTGTSPLTVASTTLVSNLNADLLDSQEGSYYLDYGNFTNTPTIPTGTDYIENGTSQQTSASFNIDGAGTLGGGLTAATGSFTGGIITLAQNKIIGSSDNLVISADYDNISGSSDISFLIDGNVKYNISTVGDHNFQSGNITTTGSLTAATGNFTNLTTGYIPYDNGTSLVDSPVYTDGTNVGIGTIAPTEKLQIEESGTSKEAIIRLIGTNSVDGASQVSHVVSYQPSGAENQIAALDFRVRSATDAYATPSTVMTLRGGSGNVGIGTVAPTEEIHVVGDGLITDTLTAGTLVKSGGTSSQFLKADGSVDASTYITSASLPTHVYNETATGLVNGVNATFTLANTPTTNSTQVYLNGLRQTLTLMYTESTNTIVFEAGYEPKTDDILRIDYIY